jgi:hypothetical protein
MDFKKSIWGVGRQWVEWEEQGRKLQKGNQVRVVEHVYNPSYSGGRGRGMMNSSFPLANLSRTYLKNKIQKVKKGLGAWLKC